MRLDGVGIQCHLRLDDPDAPDRLDRAIAAYAAEGVKVMITELDVDVLPRRARGADVAARERGGADPYRDGLPPEVAEAQARFYGRLFRVVLKHPGVVTRVTFWGTHDGDILAELLAGGGPHQSPAALGPGPQAQARPRCRPGRPGHALSGPGRPHIARSTIEAASPIVIEVPGTGGEEAIEGTPAPASFGPRCRSASRLWNLDGVRQPPSCLRGRGWGRAQCSASSQPSAAVPCRVLQSAQSDA